MKNWKVLSWILIVIFKYCMSSTIVSSDFTIHPSLDFTSNTVGHTTKQVDHTSSSPTIESTPTLITSPLDTMPPRTVISTDLPSTTGSKRITDQNISTKFSNLGTESSVQVASKDSSMQSLSTANFDSVNQLRTSFSDIPTAFNSVHSSLSVSVKYLSSLEDVSLSRTIELKNPSDTEYSSLIYSQISSTVITEPSDASQYQHSVQVSYSTENAAFPSAETTEVISVTTIQNGNRNDSTTNIIMPSPTSKTQTVNSSSAEASTNIFLETSSYVLYSSMLTSVIYTEYISSLQSSSMTFNSVISAVSELLNNSDTSGILSPTSALISIQGTMRISTESGLPSNVTNENILSMTTFSQPEVTRSTDSGSLVMVQSSVFLSESFTQIIPSPASKSSNVLDSVMSIHPFSSSGHMDTDFDSIQSSSSESASARSSISTLFSSSDLSGHILPGKSNVGQTTEYSMLSQDTSLTSYLYTLNRTALVTSEFVTNTRDFHSQFSEKDSTDMITKLSTLFVSYEISTINSVSRVSTTMYTSLTPFSLDLNVKSSNEYETVSSNTLHSDSVTTLTSSNYMQRSTLATSGMQTSDTYVTSSISKEYETVSSKTLHSDSVPTVASSSDYIQSSTLASSDMQTSDLYVTSSISKEYEIVSSKTLHSDSLTTLTSSNYMQRSTMATSGIQTSNLYVTSSISKEYEIVSSKTLHSDSLTTLTSSNYMQRSTIATSGIQTFDTYVTSSISKEYETVSSKTLHSDSVPTVTASSNYMQRSTLATDGMQTSDTYVTSSISKEYETVSSKTLHSDSVPTVTASSNYMQRSTLATDRMQTSDTYVTSSISMEYETVSSKTLHSDSVPTVASSSDYKQSSTLASSDMQTSDLYVTSSISKEYETPSSKTLHSDSVPTVTSSNYIQSNTLATSDMRTSETHVTSIISKEYEIVSSKTLHSDSLTTLTSSNYMQRSTLATSGMQTSDTYVTSSMSKEYEIVSSKTLHSESVPTVASSSDYKQSSTLASSDMQTSDLYVTSSISMEYETVSSKTLHSDSVPTVTASSDYKQSSTLASSDMQTSDLYVTSSISMEYETVSSKTLHSDSVPTVTASSDYKQSSTLASSDMQTSDLYVTSSISMEYETVSSKTLHSDSVPTVTSSTYMQSSSSATFDMQTSDTYVTSSFLKEYETASSKTLHTDSVPTVASSNYMQRSTLASSDMQTSDTYVTSSISMEYETVSSKTLHSDSVPTVTSSNHIQSSTLATSDLQTSDTYVTSSISMEYETVSSKTLPSDSVPTVTSSNHIQSSTLATSDMQTSDTYVTSSISMEYETVSSKTLPSDSVPTVTSSTYMQSSSSATFDMQTSDTYVTSSISMEYETVSSKTLPSDSVPTVTSSNHIQSSTVATSDMQTSDTYVTSSISMEYETVSSKTLHSDSVPTVTSSTYMQSSSSATSDMQTSDTYVTSSISKEYETVSSKTLYSESVQSVISSSNNMQRSTISTSGMQTSSTPKEYETVSSKTLHSDRSTTVTTSSNYMQSSTLDTSVMQTSETYVSSSISNAVDFSTIFLNSTTHATETQNLSQYITGINSVDTFPTVSPSDSVYSSGVFITPSEDIKDLLTQSSVSVFPSVSTTHDFTSHYLPTAVSSTNRFISSRLLDTETFTFFFSTHYAGNSMPYFSPTGVSTTPHLSSLPSEINSLKTKTKDVITLSQIVNYTSAFQLSPSKSTHMSPTIELSTSSMYDQTSESVQLHITSVRSASRAVSEISLSSSFDQIITSTPSSQIGKYISSVIRSSLESKQVGSASMSSIPAASTTHSIQGSSLVSQSSPISWTEIDEISDTSFLYSSLSSALTVTPMTESIETSTEVLPTRLESKQTTSTNSELSVPSTINALPSSVVLETISAYLASGPTSKHPILSSGQYITVSNITTASDASVFDKITSLSSLEQTTGVQLSTQVYSLYSSEQMTESTEMQEYTASLSSTSYGSQETTFEMTSKDSLQSLQTEFPSSTHLDISSPWTVLFTSQAPDSIATLTLIDIHQSISTRFSTTGTSTIFTSVISHLNSSPVKSPTINLLESSSLLTDSNSVTFLTAASLQTSSTESTASLSPTLMLSSSLVITPSKASISTEQEVLSSQNENSTTVLNTTGITSVHLDTSVSATGTVFKIFMTSTASYNIFQSIETGSISFSYVTDHLTSSQMSLTSYATVSETQSFTVNASFSRDTLVTSIYNTSEIFSNSSMILVPSPSLTSPLLTTLFVSNASVTESNALGLSTSSPNFTNIFTLPVLTDSKTTTESQLYRSMSSESLVTLVESTVVTEKISVTKSSISPSNVFNVTPSIENDSQIIMTSRPSFSSIDLITSSVVNSLDSNLPDISTTESYLTTHESFVRTTPTSSTVRLESSLSTSVTHVSLNTDSVEISTMKNSSINATQPTTSVRLESSILPSSSHSILLTHVASSSAIEESVITSIPSTLRIESSIVSLTTHASLNTNQSNTSSVSELPTTFSLSPTQFISSTSISSQSYLTVSGISAFSVSTPVMVTEMTNSTTEFTATVTESMSSLLVSSIPGNNTSYSTSYTTTLRSLPARSITELSSASIFSITGTLIRSSLQSTHLFPQVQSSTVSSLTLQSSHTLSDATALLTRTSDIYSSVQVSTEVLESPFSLSPSVPESVFSSESSSLMSKTSDSIFTTFSTSVVQSASSVTVESVLNFSMSSDIYTSKVTNSTTQIIDSLSTLLTTSVVRSLSALSENSILTTALPSTSALKSTTTLYSSLSLQTTTELALTATPSPTAALNSSLPSEQTLSLTFSLQSTSTIDSSLTLRSTATLSSTPNLPSTSPSPLSSTPTLPSSSIPPSTPTLPSTSTLSSTPILPSTSTLSSTPTLPSSSIPPSTPKLPSTATLSSTPILPSTSTLSSTPTLPSSSIPSSTSTLPSTSTQLSTPILPSLSILSSTPILSSTSVPSSRPTLSSTSILSSTPTLPSTSTVPSTPILLSASTLGSSSTLRTTPAIPLTPTLLPTQTLSIKPTPSTTRTLSSTPTMTPTIKSRDSVITEVITTPVQVNVTTVSITYSSISSLFANASDMEGSTISLSPSSSLSSMIPELPSMSITTVTSVTSSVSVTTSSITPTTTVSTETTTLNGTNANEGFWVRTVLKMQLFINVSDPSFVSNMENGLANAYNEAFRRQKLIEQGKFEPLQRRRRRKRYTKVGDASVHIHDISRVEGTTTVVADYTVEKSGKVLTAEEAVTALDVLDTQELAIILKQVVDVKAEPYSQTEKPNEPKEDDSQLLLYGVIAGSVAGVIIVVWVIVCIYCKCCRHKNTEEDAEPELTSIQPQSSNRKTSLARPLPTTPHKKPLVSQGSKFSLRKGRTYQINDGYVPEKETEEQTLLKSPRKKKTQSPISSVNGSTTVTPVMPKKELVPPAVQKGRRNSKNSIGPTAEDLDINHDIMKLGSLQGDRSLLFQSSVSEDSDDTKKQLKMQKKKNKDRMSEKFGQEIEAKHGDKGNENTESKVLGMPNTVVPSFVIESGSPSKEPLSPLPLSRKNSDGNTSGDENLEEARTRMHKLLDDAFSLISPRSSFTENDLRKGTSSTKSQDEKPSESNKSTSNAVDVDKAIETLKGFTNPAYTSSYSEFLETWSPYRASDQVALISMPHKPEPVVTRLGYKPDKRPLTSNTAANFARRPAANLDLTNSRSTNDLSESGKYTTNAPKPIVIRTKDEVPNTRLESAKSNKLSNELKTNRKLSATALNNDILLRGSSTSLTKPAPQAKSNSLEMQPVKRNRSNSIRKHREPEKDNRNRDEIDVIKNIKPEEASDKLFQSLRDEIKSNKTETEDDINKKPIRRRNRKTHSKPMTDIV